MKYIFGPVNSRRLGLSLGIDLLPPKICNFDCVYCEVGRTTLLTCERAEYIPTEEIIAEIDRFTDDQALMRPVDVFTITASGEPTLHTGIGQIIGHIKKKTSKPVCVLTNGSLLYKKDVREDLMQADIVIPSLDAATQESYQRINRPADCIALETIIQGLCRFKKEFTGKYLLEILIAKGLNDDPENIKALKESIKKIQPDMVQLNTVSRPAPGRAAQPLNPNELKKLAAKLEGHADVIGDFAKRDRKGGRSVGEIEIVSMVQRRPCTIEDVCEALGAEPAHAGNIMEKLTKTGILCKIIHSGKTYYQPC
ncbi:MAG: radical SAM protein [Desulfobulbaceae bacterium]|nr:radical SAM protein [Desulfobulbaceae bacterium]